MQSTVGQFAVGPAGSTHVVGSGYWYGIARGAVVVTYGIYLPVVLRGYGP